MNLKEQPFTLIWEMLGKDSGLAERFGVPGYEGYLPFFVQKDEIDPNGRVVFDENMLIFGICYGLHDHYYSTEPYPNLTKEDIRTYQGLFVQLARGFRMPNPEETFLSIGNHFQKHFGTEPAMRVLETGIKFLDGAMPCNAMRSNLCLAYWRYCDSLETTQDRAKMANYLEAALQKFEWERNLPDANQFVAYIALALYALNGQKTKAQEAYARLKSWDKKAKLLRMAEIFLQDPNNGHWLTFNEAMDLVGS